MSVIFGSDGAIQFDLGPGLRYVANVFEWKANFGRETLDTTKQGDEARTRTGGLADHTGDVSIRIELSDDNSIADSAWQLLTYAINNDDDDLKADIKLIIQSAGGNKLCSESPFGSFIGESVYFEGTVVVSSVSLTCGDPGDPIVAVLNWEADGKLLLARS